MRVSRRSVGLIVLFVALTAGCGAGGSPSAPVLPEASRHASVDPTAVFFGTEESAVGNGSSMSQDGATSTASGSPTPSVFVEEGEATSTASGSPTPNATARSATVGSMAPRALTTAPPSSSADPANPVPPMDEVALRTAARGSPFYEFGDEVFAWDDDRQIIVLAVPVDHPALYRMREQLGNRHGTIEDTTGTRSWVQACARRHSAAALDKSDAVFGQVAAQSVYSCLGGLTHLAELFASYWWTEAGVACVAEAVTAYSLVGDAHPHPLAVCPSIGYDPTALRPRGWLAQRCAEIVATHPKLKYPSDPAHSSDPLPSCWNPVVDIVQTHAAENAEIGVAGSPHACFHAFLGYVWARQTEREGRSPSDLAIGCHYRAFEAVP